MPEVPANERNERKNRIFEYLKILHEHGVGSQAAKEFRERFSADPELQELGSGAEELVRRKDEILARLDKLKKPPRNRWAG